LAQQQNYLKEECHCPFKVLSYYLKGRAQDIDIFVLTPCVLNANAETPLGLSWIRNQTVVVP
jgi:hypothetical protein